MELEELQKAWKELNERVSQNELVHQSAKLVPSAAI